MGCERDQTAAGEPLRCGHDVIGFIVLDAEGPGAYGGVFTPGPDFERYRPLFERVFELQHRVDESADADYLAAWHDWQQSLEEIQGLDLTFGAANVPVEGFEVDDSWRVTFHAAVWWLAMSDDA